MNIPAEFLAQIVGREHQRAAGVFLLAQAKQIRGVADLRFDLLLAIAEIVVRDERDDDAAFVAAGEFERAAVVVAFVLFAPAHAVTALTFRGLIPMGQADGLFCDLHQMRRENDAAGVPRPMLRIKAGIVLRQQGIAGVAKNAFDKIQVAHEIARGEEPDFHRLLRHETGNSRANDRAQQQGDEAFRRLRLRGGEWQAHQFTRRTERETRAISKR